ncbi:hypothetical protein AUO94_00430 [Planococcus kocurii]|uniref:DUF3006 domain-containing protein n=1 Tax=Planococcus kocurii TaxID=1374 RepID=A0ABM5WSS4_9BACL|nr:DUF3006 domain-containing protein [Planococcus kocurii]ALS77200.1 hypothetical protein AUO94_00430 [Planococcus kocurii]
MKSNKYTLDRYDEEFAVLVEKGNESHQKLIERSKLESYAKEGDILDVEWNPDGTFKEASVLETETEERRVQVTALIEKLKNKK